MYARDALEEAPVLVVRKDSAARSFAHPPLPSSASPALQTCPANITYTYCYVHHATRHQQEPIRPAEAVQTLT